MNLMKEALRFICSCNFWRMALFWNIALLFSYFQFLKKSIFGSKSSTSSCSKSNHSHTPVCVITGNGYGRAADPGAVKTNMTFLHMNKSLRFVGGDEVPTEVAVKPPKPDQLQTITTTIHLKVS